MNFYVAGVRHHKFYEIAEELKEGDSVQLIPEPTNEYDKFAVKIEALKTMLGYVPKLHSKVISEMIADSLFRGKPLSVKIVKLSPELDPWDALRIKVERMDKDG